LKQYLSQQFGYPAAPRLPLLPMGGDASAQLSQNDYIKQILDLERASQ
jgi:hypothetical protein